MPITLETELSPFLIFTIFDEITIGTTPFENITNTSYELNTSSFRAVVRGTGFAFASPLPGVTLLSEGTVTEIDIFVPGNPVTTVRNINITAEEFAPLVTAEILGTDTGAVENFLQGQQWNITFGDGADIAPEGTIVSPDNVLFNLRNNDFILTQGGNDNFFSGDGNDTVDGGTGNDTLDGGFGFDLLFGGTGNDVLFGGAQGDGLDGGSGADSLIGAQGNDLLVGGLGNDTLNGGANDDDLFGGSGRDVLNGQFGNDLLEGGSGLDRLLGGIGDDTLNGGEQADFLAGSNGVDILNGEGGNDRLFGGIGNDILNGGADNDLVVGQFGRDTLLGAEGNDTLNGFSGFDVLNGGSGNDILNGGFNADIFVFGDNFGNDIIQDFEIESNFERIDFSTNSNINSFTDVFARLSFIDGVTRITDGDNSIVLAGVNAGDLRETDFIF